MKKHLSLLITTASAALALAYVFFMFFPGQKKIAELRKSLQQEQQYVAESAKLVAVINDLERQIAECESFISNWRSQSPHGGKMADLISRITADATESHVNLVAFHPSAAERHAMLRELPATMKVEGSFHGIAEFLRRLESLSASIWIPSVNIKPAGETGQTLRCELTLSIFSDAIDIAD